MIQVHCDGCGKELVRDEESHYVVQIEIVAMPSDELLAIGDLAADNLEAVSDLLKAQENGNVNLPMGPEREQMRLDLCAACREKFQKNPLHPDSVAHFDFSQN